MDLYDWYAALLTSLGKYQTGPEKIEFLRGVETTTPYEAQLVVALSLRTEAVTIHEPQEKAASYAQAADLFGAIDHEIATALAAESRAFVKVVKASNQSDPAARARIWAEAAVEFHHAVKLATYPQLCETYLLCAGWNHLARAFAAQAVYQIEETADLSELRTAAEGAKQLFLQFGTAKLLGLACSLLHYVSAMEAKAAFEQGGEESARIDVIKHMRAAADQITTDEYAAIRDSYQAYAEMVECEHA